MIEDERSLLSLEEFRKLFFTYFKGEAKASAIYDKLLTCIVQYRQGKNVFDEPPEEGEYEARVSIQKLTKFIDAFNFYPLRVNKIHAKNDSQALTGIMTSEAFVSLATKAERYKESQAYEAKNKHLFTEETRILKLLALVSAKITERFRNLREAFRYIDTDHS